MSSPEEQTLIVKPGRRPRSVVHEGAALDVPDGWELLPPGDAGLTRRVKAGGPTWTEKEKKGRRTFSLGVWAPAERIAAARAAVEAQRETPAYRRKLAADRERRARAHAEYVVEFELSVATFLDFHPSHRALERSLAKAVAQHATPVGSGTVARTQRIPVEQRAEAAVIAWLRHRTTAYDHMSIERVRGRRREVRRELARESRRLLDRYRRGEESGDRCPLRAALGTLEDAPAEAAPAEAAPVPEPVERELTDREAEQRALYEKVRARFER